MMRGARNFGQQQGGRRSFSAGVCGLLAALALSAAATPAHAAPADDEVLPDARLMSYEGNTSLGVGSSTTGSYLASILLGAIAVAVLFKSSGRTHLD